MPIRDRSQVPRYRSSPSSWSSVFLLSAFSSFFYSFRQKILPFGVNCRLQFALSLREKREERVNLLYVESESYHSQYSSPDEALNLTVESKSLPAEVNNLNIELHFLFEVKEKPVIILFCGF